MGCRALIGVVMPDGSVRYIYVHFGGMLEHTGKLLLQYYNTADAAAQLVARGSARQLLPPSEPMEYYHVLDWESGDRSGGKGPGEPQVYTEPSLDAFCDNVPANERRRPFFGEENVYFWHPAGLWFGRVDVDALARSAAGAAGEADADGDVGYCSVQSWCPLTPALCEYE